jgi:hypothetical protein
VQHELMVYLHSPTPPTEPSAQVTHALAQHPRMGQPWAMPRLSGHPSLNDHAGHTNEGEGGWGWVGGGGMLCAMITMKTHDKLAEHAQQVLLRRLQLFAIDKAGGIAPTVNEGLLGHGLGTRSDLWGLSNKVGWGPWTQARGGGPRGTRALDRPTPLAKSSCTSGNACEAEGMLPTTPTPPQLPTFLKYFTAESYLDFWLRYCRAVTTDTCEIGAGGREDGGGGDSDSDERDVGIAPNPAAPHSRGKGVAGMGLRVQLPRRGPLTKPRTT